ncbi:MAG TPA: type IVB secretion system protein IcmH/DotU [Polyangiaceae bacterium]|nr:type IVB secretion system protein IcmH/DotU [Polyangiaceae bacterium]
MNEPVYWACGDILVLAAQLPLSQNLPPPAELRQRMLTALDAMVGRGRAVGVPDPDLAEARYALTAFIDEQILKSNWPGKSEWMQQPLQLLLYREFTAGENFFVRLRALLQQGNRGIALEAYYLCLLLGFRGAYGVSGDMQSLQGFVEAARQQIQRGLPSANKFGPHVEPKDRAQAARGSGLTILILAVACVFSSALLLFLLERLLAGSARDVLEAMPLGSARYAP